MAYVGTPSRMGSSTATLASIIQGEAGGEGITGMRAVAGVIGNRASQNFSGYGTGLLDQALARNQFQGQSGSYSPQAFQVAQELESGRLVDPTGGATSYANPGASTARWAVNLNSGNSVQIGNHYFTDNQQGIPFHGNGTQASNGVSTSSDGTVAAAGQTVTTNAGDGTINSMTTNPDGSANVELGGSNPSDTATSPTGGGTGTATQGSGQTAPAGAQQGGAGTSQNAGSGSGGSGFGAYLNEVARAIANQLSPSTEKAGQTVASATTQSGQTIAKGSTDAAQIAAAQSKATNTLFSDLSKDYFGRAIVVILGIVFVAGGVAMFVYNRNPIALAKSALT